MLKKIISVIGEPEEDSYLFELPNSAKLCQLIASLGKFGKSGESKFSAMCPNLCDAGYNLLQKLLSLDPKDWISADEALKHSYFMEVDPIQFKS